MQPIKFVAAGPGCVDGLTQVARTEEGIVSETDASIGVIGNHSCRAVPDPQPDVESNIGIRERPLHAAEFCVCKEKKGRH